MYHRSRVHRVGYYLAAGDAQAVPRLAQATPASAGDDPLAKGGLGIRSRRRKVYDHSVVQVELGSGREGEGIEGAGASASFGGAALRMVAAPQV